MKGCSVGSPAESKEPKARDHPQFYGGSGGTAMNLKTNTEFRGWRGGFEKPLGPTEQQDGNKGMKNIFPHRSLLEKKKRKGIFFKWEEKSGERLGCSIESL